MVKPCLIVAAVALFVPACVHAQTAAKNCEELKSEIAKKIEANGVKTYTLDIVDKDKEVTEGKVVGTCGGGTKKIVYVRGTAEAKAPAADAKK